MNDIERIIEKIGNSQLHIISNNIIAKSVSEYIEEAYECGYRNGYEKAKEIFIKKDPIFKIGDKVTPTHGIFKNYNGTITQIIKDTNSNDIFYTVSIKTQEDTEEIPSYYNEFIVYRAEDLELYNEEET